MPSDIQAKQRRDAAKRSNVYSPAAVAASQKIVTAIGALAQQDQTNSATYVVVQPGDRFGRVLITVEPLGPGPF